MTLTIHRTILPSDSSTLFICSGMQRYQSRFLNPNQSRLGTLQSCIRCKDLDLIGDSSHLSSFEMLGHFSFGRNDYPESCELWRDLVDELDLPITHVTVHPDRLDHRDIWRKLGFKVVFDPDCSWTDGTIQGHCCELFVGELEVGNLVNPLRHSVDVGFGLERILQVMEGKERITDTSLFPEDLPPILADHRRTLLLMKENGVKPGPKGRESICRRLVQRCLRQGEDLPSMIPELSDWWEDEERLAEKRLERGRRRWRKFKDRDERFWLETFGLTHEDLRILREREEKGGF